MTNPYAGMDLVSLRQSLGQKVTERSNGTLTADQLKPIDDEMALIKAALNDKIAEGGADDGDLKKGSDNAIKQETLIRLREVKASVDCVAKFTPNTDVYVFLGQLNNVYELNVKGQSDNCEQSFLRAAKQRLCDSYLTQMLNSGKVVTTFAEFKSYMIVAHESKLTHFQRLNRLWEIAPKSNESMVDVASRLENEAHDVMISVEATYKAKHANVDMPSKALLDLVLGQIMLSHIASSKHRSALKYIVTDLDDAWTASQVAMKAATIIDRTKDDDASTAPTFAIASAPVAGKAEGKSGGYGGGAARGKWNGAKKQGRVTPSKDRDCWFYLDGHCKKGDSCPWRHDSAKCGTGRPRKSGDSVSLVALPTFRQ